jgi:hypothetical protein
MKSPNKSHKSIKDLFDDPRIPQEIDIRDQVMTRMKREKERLFVKYKISLLVALGLFASITTGYAAVQYYELKNEKGDVVYQEKSISQEEVPNIVKGPSPEQEAYDKKIKEIEEKMEPGAVAAVYFADHYPEKTIYFASKSFEMANIADLQSKLGEAAYVPKTLPGGFTFRDAIFDFSFKNGYDAEAMHQQAVKEKKEVVIKPLELTDELKYLFATYEEPGGGYVNLYIAGFGEAEEFTHYVVGPDETKKEVLKVGKTEVLYTEEPVGDGVNATITWVTEDAGKKMQYEVSADRKVLNKKNFHEFMEAVVTKK